MGAGKTWAASYLEREHGAVCWSRTEMMKRLAHSLADHIDSPDQVLERLFSDESAREEVREELLDYISGYQPEPSVKPRRLYQDVAEICQAHDPICFETELEKRIRSSLSDEVKRDGFWVIDDVRKEAGFEFFASRGYRPLRIEASERVRKQRIFDRDRYLPSPDVFTHPSETELDRALCEFTISNDSDLTEFAAELDKLVSEIR